MFVIAEAIEALPLANTPEVFGLHSNAEIGYYTQAARDMWAHLLELQPQTGTVHREDEVGAGGCWSKVLLLVPRVSVLLMPVRQPPGLGPQSTPCCLALPDKYPGFRGIEQWHQPRRLHWQRGQGHREQDAQGLQLGPGQEAPGVGNLPHIGGAPAGAGTLQQAHHPDVPVPS